MASSTMTHHIINLELATKYIIIINWKQNKKTKLVKSEWSVISSRFGRPPPRPAAPQTHRILNQPGIGAKINYYKLPLWNPIKQKTRQKWVVKYFLSSDGHRQGQQRHDSLHNQPGIGAKIHILHIQKWKPNKKKFVKSEWCDISLVPQRAAWDSSAMNQHIIKKNQRLAAFRWPSLVFIFLLFQPLASSVDCPVTIGDLSV